MNKTVIINGLEMEMCLCGSGDIGIKKTHIQPKGAIGAFQMTCNVCGERPDIWNLSDDMIHHYKVWNAHIKKKRKA